MAKRKILFVVFAVFVIVSLISCSTGSSNFSAPTPDHYATAMARIEKAAATPTTSVADLLSAYQTAQAQTQPETQPQFQKGERSYFDDNCLYEWSGTQWAYTGLCRKFVQGTNNLVFDVFSENEPGPYTRVDVSDKDFIYVYYYKTDTWTAIKRTTGVVYYKTGNLWLIEEDIQATAVSNANSSQAATAQANQADVQRIMNDMEQRKQDLIHDLLIDNCGYYDPNC